MRVVTLRLRLATIATVVFGLVLAALAVASYAVLARRLDADVSERLIELSQGLHGYLRVSSEAADVAYDPRDNDQAAFVHEATRYFQVFDLGSGDLLAESDGMAPLGLQLTTEEVHALADEPALVDVQTEWGRLRLSSSVKPSATGAPYLLQVGVPLAPVEAALRRYRDLLLWSVPAALFVAGFAFWWLSVLALRPLALVAAAAARIDVTTLDLRLPVRGAGDELDHVAGAFNETLSRLDHAVGEMRQFSAALAHELRTPLAALRGQIELALRDARSSPVQRDAFGSQLEEIDRLTRLIDQILTLARAESGQIRIAMAPVDLGDLAVSIVDQLEPVAAAKSVALRVEPREGSVSPAVVEGDAGWLERLLLNLLDNAIKYTSAGGEIVVRVTREALSVRVAVQDTGAGLSPEDARHVFDRFFRADPARSSSAAGAGLGLSLVQWIARQHHGSVAVQSQLDRGTTFTVTLPSASSNAAARQTGT